MKNKFFTIAVMCGCMFLAACASDGEEFNPGPKPNPEPPVAVQKDTVDFRVLVYIDKLSVEGHLGGSEKIVRSKMTDLFRQVTAYWNKCAQGKLDFYYRYSLADMVVYEGASDDAALRRKIYDDPMDFNQYDVSVLFDCLQDNGETGNGGGAHGGGSDHRSVITVIAGKEPKDIFNETTRNTLTHELDHYRGVTDLYQYLIAANDNPVNHQAYEGPIDCIMNWAGAGVWSEYALNCMNRAGKSKQIGKDFTDFFGSLYPKRIEFDITVGGQPKRGVGIKLYGSRAGGTNRNRDIWPEAFVTGQTNRDGKFLLTDAKRYFNPDREEFKHVPSDLPYGRWFGFLAEITYNSTKKYVWMPEYLVQMPAFEGNDTYSVKVEF